MENGAVDDMLPKRPSRNPKPTATLLEHSKGAALPSQQKKINEYRAAEAAKHVKQNIPAASSTATTPAPNNAPSPSLSLGSASALTSSSSDIHIISGSLSGKRKAVVLEELEDNVSDTDGVSVCDVSLGQRKQRRLFVLIVHCLITIFQPKSHDTSQILLIAKASLRTLMSSL